MLVNIVKIVISRAEHNSAVKGFCPCLALVHIHRVLYFKLRAAKGCVLFLLPNQFHAPLIMVHIILVSLELAVYKTASQFDHIKKNMKN